MFSRAHVVFHGKVQGVFFRSNTERKAIELEVNGWIINRPNGTVEAVFEGSKNRIKNLIEWCRKEQPYAKVNEVKVTWESYRNEFDEFEIRY